MSVFLAPPPSHVDRVSYRKSNGRPTTREECYEETLDTPTLTFAFPHRSHGSEFMPRRESVRSKHATRITVTAVSCEWEDMFEVFAFFPAEHVFSSDQVRDIEPRDRSLCQGDRSRFDTLAIL
jgi:hypothetical protein